MKTMKDLADEMIAALDREYDLVYVDYDDKLTEEQTHALIRGDLETLWEKTGDWEDECRWLAVKEILPKVYKEVTDAWHRESEEPLDLDLLGLGYEEFELTEEWDRVRDEVYDRDASNWLKQLVSHTPDVLMRVIDDRMGEDASFSFREVTPQEILDTIEFEHTEHNIKALQVAIDNASPEFSVILGMWVWAADVSQFLDFHEDDTIEVVNPHLWLGNPFAGSGYCTDDGLDGTIRLARTDLRTDKDAFGYGWNEVTGGTYTSAYSAEMRRVPIGPATEQEVTA